jgi:pimeloyl-ACP methyl ester carboxylesterase/class 3 adenylate cyclase
VTVPETRYAKSGDVNIAYQVSGGGPFDIVVVPGSVSHVELMWDFPGYGDVLRRLTDFSRVIHFDKRGTGMSDRMSESTTFEQRMDDIRAVMEAAESERAALVGVSEGAPMSVLFAATYPERVTALVLYGGLARTVWAPDYPWGTRPDAYERGTEEEERIWRTPGAIEKMVRDFAPDASEAAVRAMVAVFRSASPGAIVDLDRLNASIDVRQALPLIRVPTLVIHQGEDSWVRVEHGRYLAEHIPTARYKEFPGSSHVILEDMVEPLSSEIQGFLEEAWGGGWDMPEPESVLATVLFTDIVGSTSRAVELGDRGWRDLLERHNREVRRELSRFNGVELDTAGDGFFARFDGPARAIRCASAITDAVGGLGLEIRSGLHTGECQVLEGKVAGLAVSIGARVAAQAAPGEVLVSHTVKDLVAGSGIEFADRGVAELKGVPGEWRLYAVADA